ncbi:MAG: rhamnulokinase family protein [Candidatus Poribacteria bacterium]
MQEKFLAFDLGASSGRAVVGILENDRLKLDFIHRFPNRPVSILGTLYWDVLFLFDEMQRAMRIFSQKYGGFVEGIGVDTWGVDFGLIGRDGALLSNPVHYRDARTNGMMEEVFKRAPKEEIYFTTGIQFMQINTLYQLFSMVKSSSPLLKAASTLLMMPDLFNYFITGTKRTEFTNATTTQFYESQKGNWATSLLEKLSIPSKILPKIVPPGTILGNLLPSISENVGLETAKVIAPACHDTASAVAAVPAVEGEDWAYISCGTWAVVGIEVQHPVINEQSFQLNFTNEGGVGGTYRFLKNVAGLWLIQECKRMWEKSGRVYEYEELTQLAAEAKPFVAFIDPDYGSFLNPADMPTSIIQFCERTGQQKPATKGEIVRCVLESLSLKKKVVLDMITKLHGPIRRLHLVGGGARNSLLCQFLANATGIPVIAGPVEATLIGNIIMQTTAVGILPSIEEGRKLISHSFELITYEPQEMEVWEKKYQRFLEILQRPVCT